MFQRFVRIEEEKITHLEQKSSKKEAKRKLDMIQVGVKMLKTGRNGSSLLV